MLFWLVNEISKLATGKDLPIGRTKLAKILCWISERGSAVESVEINPLSGESRATVGRSDNSSSPALQGLFAHTAFTRTLKPSRGFGIGHICQSAL